MARVSQAAGRVIRTETDRGVVVLVGNRFADPTFRNLFPSEWNLQDTSNLGMELQKFFGFSTIT
jgi:Rad3-related DNA helicase